ncbi:MAG: class III extradiol dioxygenase subunit B-like domain-containing protein [Candidatus Falkowbacteria bacterium]|nr:class III extradiol dioxygenase subunit B-like domain-containing protein [Candidatus Falkowbacteria bacterium]
MPILAAALLPHSPLLIPEIGKSNYKFLQKTVAAYQKIIDDLKAKEITTIFLLSPHGPIQADIFTINTAPEFGLSLEEFGFLNNKKIKGDLALAYNIKDNLKKTFNIQQITEIKLDYGSAIPLYLINEQIPNLKALILYYSELDLDKHWSLGQALFPLLNNNPAKIAVIASGDLSHRLKKSSPGGYSPKGAKFDNKLIEYLNKPEDGHNNILNLDQNLIKDAGECGLKSITILLGILENLRYEPQVLAYQTDFGIGYLSMDFKLI